MEILITDNFIWALLDEETAREAYLNDKEVFLLYDDGTEALIVDGSDIVLANLNGNRLGVEIDHEEELKSDWQEECARNKDSRSFEAWLEDKAESILY